MDKKKITEGTEVKGSGHFKNLRGRVIDQKESGFGMRYALVKPAKGDPEWANESYLSPLA